MPAPSHASSAEPHVEVQNVSKRFGTTQVLSGINLSVGRGDVAVIVGGSGAGKTTLLRILIGLDRATSGSVLVAGADIAKMNERELNSVRRKFGMVFQYSALLDSMNVLENVAFPLREHTRLSEKEIRDRVREKLQVLDLAGTERRFPSELSGGMRKRVGLARALILEPEVVMYDEPTSGLDPVTSRKVDRLILDTRERFGVTSIVISHDMVGALSIADRLFFLASGRIAAEGKPAELLKNRSSVFEEFLDASGVRGTAEAQG